MLKNCIILLSAVLAACSGHDSLQRQIQDYVDKCPAEIGVAFVTRGDTVVVNDGLYPMNSVLKLFQALPTARAMSARSIAWDSVAAIPTSSLDPDTWSPMLKETEGDTLRVTFGQLLDYALSQSDNNACDVLLTSVAGIDSVCSFWRARGLDGFQIKWNEAQMHALPSRSDDNCTTPLTAARLVGDTFFNAMISSDFVTSQVAGTLMHCATGQNRIPAALHGIDAIVAHKTGTGFNDSNGNPTGINDVAHIILPDGRSYSLAVFVKSSKTDLEQTEKMIADISAIVLRHVTAATSPSSPH